MAAEHRHEIPLRWADLDSLNHVNNVVYVRYAAEARSRLVDEGQLPDARITHIGVEFRRPIQLGRRPAVVTSHVTDDELVQDIGLAGSEQVFARVTTGWTPVARPAPADGSTATTLALRRTDLDDRGVVDPVQAFELLQESRIPYITALMDGTQRGAVVLAHVDVRYHAAIPAPSVESRVWVERIGDSSFTVGAQLCRGGEVAVSSLAVLVGFDASTQRSRTMSDAERAALRRGLPV